LTFSDGANPFIGDMSEFLPVLYRLKWFPLPFLTEHFALQNTLDAPAIGSVRIPAIVFCVYQLMFAAITYVPLPYRQRKPPNH
jgi:Amt family ammonium transporter